MRALDRTIAATPPTIGETEAFDLEPLYRTYARTVARWAGRLAGPGLDVEDLLHEVFIIAHRRLPGFRGDAAQLRTWLYRTTAFVVRKRRHRERLRRFFFKSADKVTREAPSFTPTPLEELERRRRTDLVYRILETLPEKYRTALILFDLEGLSGEEVADLTGQKLSTLRVRLFRAREQFLERINAIETEVLRG